ncbi:MAG: hypothetical protein VW014_03365 [Halieaceae bacterium]
MSKRKLLYITSVPGRRDLPPMSDATKSVLSLLSRDFEISLAVAGPVSALDLNALRGSLGVTRVAGGFERGTDDANIEGAQKVVHEFYGLDPFINSRLKAAIQRRAADFESVVIDGLPAIPYLPLGVQGKTVYFAQSIVSDDEKLGKGLLGGRRVKRVRGFEYDAMLRCDRVFSTPESANALLELGLPLGKLVDEATQPSAARPTTAVSGFSSTRMRLGYAGYLGDEQNVASLMWFLENVWSAIRDAVPGLEFHVIGADASEELAVTLSSHNDVVLHRDSRDRKITELGLRVMVEPLLHEHHIEAKLVNAMVRGIPIAISREALTKSRLDVGDAVSVADSPAHMVLNLRRLLSEATLWQALSDRSQRIGSTLLAYHEVAHSMRRLLVQVES